jgi:hypothetical protein
MMHDTKDVRDCERFMASFSGIMEQGLRYCGSFCSQGLFVPTLLFSFFVASLLHWVSLYPLPLSFPQGKGTEGGEMGGE